MTDWNRIANEKAAHRKSSAERPLEEKLRTLDRLRERSKSLSGGVIRSKSTFAADKGAITSGRATNLIVFGAGTTLVASIRPTTTTTTAALFGDKGSKR